MCIYIHFHVHLYSFLVRYNLLHLAQSGFRMFHSCETALAKMASRWAANMDRGDLTGLVLLDLRKAFDMVDHNILLEKLAIYHFSDNALLWFRSYLSDRTQRVQFQQAMSEPLTMTSGVPQGSILGPLLSILYMNDLPLEMEHCELDMYADDSTLESAEKTVEGLENNLSSDMANVERWCSLNKMVLNIKKTKAMLISTYQKLRRLTVKTLSINVQGELLENVTSEKLLGVIVDQNLSWKAHVDKVHKTVSMLLAKFRRIKPFLPTDARIRYVQAFIFPHFDYCSTVWGSAQLDRLYKLQKRAARMVFDLPTKTPTKPLLKRLNWMSVKDRVEYRRTVMVYRSLNGTAPQYMKDMFTNVSDVSSRNTRYVDSSRLYLPAGKHLKVYTDSFQYAAGEA